MPISSEHLKLFESLGESGVRARLEQWKAGELQCIEAKEWLSVFDAERSARRDAREEETIELAREANRIASEANRVASRAELRARNANIWAAIAALIAAISAAITMCHAKS
jgi:hypothetical protein